MKLLLSVMFTMSVLYSQMTFANYTQTKYPIVLVHGIFGFDDIVGIDYFYGIPQALTSDGAQVFVASVSAANSSQLRGEQLLVQVEYILALTGAEKVNLFGHSQGAQTVRYVASVKPELVASVTSIGGVNWGSKVADIVRNTVPEGSFTEAFADTLANGLAAIISFFSGQTMQPQDALAALEVLTTSGTLSFNQRYPEGVPNHYCGEGEMLASNGVMYFSWSGSKGLTNILDPLDGAISLLSLAFSEPSDGLVSSCSSHLGLVIKDNYKMNHLDEINHSFGIHHLFETDPVTVYRRHANRLKNIGL